jgi:GNAT superfamily N-acetyltransferase
VSAVRIRSARPDEGERLRGIAIAAKSHWGYDPDQVERWAAQGDFSARALAEKQVLVAESNGRAVAFAGLAASGEVCVLDDLWVEPTSIGRGIGTTLFEVCVERARDLGAKRLEWEAEPNAVGFYEKLGARHLRMSDQTAWGRQIPVMGLDL